MRRSFERGQSRSIRDEATLIDELCDRYEKEWNGEAAPRIEDYLAGVEGEVRSMLWLELVMVDQQLHHKRGEPRTLADYKERCPDERIWLDVSTAGGASEVEDPTAAPGEVIADPFLTTAGRDDDATGPINLPSTMGAGAVDRASMPAGPPQARPGAVLGDYELIVKLGEGGMGIVFKARQRRLNRIVAIKMIRSGVLASRREVRLFQREAEAVAALDHPNIVPILETGEQGDLLFYSMKLINGGNLQEALASFKNQPAAIARLVVTVADAIRHAHERGVLHRDLKPSNILVGEAGEPFVIDFGLAKLLEHDESTVASAGSAVGTPSYMAPEQAQGQRDQITTATDVYGLGTLLYALLTGRSPFHADTAHETIRQVIHEEPRRPRLLNPQVDPDLETICLKCLEKEPKTRYASARELAEDLERWRAGEPIVARPVSTTERLWKYARRHPWGSGMVGLLALTVAIGSSGIVWQWRQAVAARGGLQFALGVAERNEKAARKSEDAAKKSEDYARHLAYAAKLNLAERDWRDANVAAVRRQLEETSPQPGKTDLRGFEWYYLDRLSRSQGRALPEHRHVVTSVAYSPDGRRLASASWDATINVSDATTGKLIRTIKAGEDQAIAAVIFHPDGTRLASAGKDKVVTLWDVATGQAIRTFAGHTLAIQELAISPGGKILASSSKDGTVKLWDVDTGALVRTLADHHVQGSGEIAFSPDGKTLASAGGGERTVRIWDVAEGTLFRTLNNDATAPGGNLAAGSSTASRAQPRLPVVFSPNGKILATGAEDGTIKLWDAAAGSLVRTLRDFHNLNAVVDLAFSPDGKSLASASYAGQTVFLWDVATGYVLRTIKGHNDVINCVAFSPDGMRLASASADRMVKIWDITRDQEARSLPGKDVIHDVAFGHDGSYLLSAGLDGSVVLWDVATGATVRSFPGHTGMILGVTVSRDGRRAASGGEDRSVRVWEIATGREIHALKGHTAAAIDVAFSPDGKTLASASLDRTIKLWDVDTGREIKTVEGHASGVRCVAFSTDGNTLVSAGKDDGFVLFRDLASGRQVQAIKGNWGGVRAMALSPDGRLVASAGHDQTLNIWEVATGQQVHSLKGHAAVVNELAFSPDGRRLASASGDGTVRIWDPIFGEELFVLRGHTSMVAAVAFSPDGTRLASAGSDRTVKLWEASTGSELPRRP